MTTVTTLLDQAKAAKNITTDMALAEALGVTRAAVSGWRSGIRYPDEVTCARLATMTDQPLARVLGIVGEARSISKEAKAVWRSLANAAALVLLIGAAALPQVAAAAEPGTKATAPGLYIMSIRRWLRVLFRSPAPLAPIPA